MRSAIAQREEAESRRKKKGEEKKKEARASTTDPEARVMKMGDGGFAEVARLAAWESSISSQPPIAFSPL